jgi:hypothetical protein
MTALHQAVEDFLLAVDRGYFGDALMVGPTSDRRESEFVADLRRAGRGTPILRHEYDFTDSDRPDETVSDNHAALDRETDVERYR